MNKVHIFYLFFIFLTLLFIEYNDIQYQHKFFRAAYTLDSLEKELDTLQVVHKDLCKALDNLPLSSPLKTIVIGDKYGYRKDPFTKKSTFHGGIDLKGSRKDTIYAPGNGIVKKASWNAGYGRCIVIQHVDGYQTLYAHLSKIFVAVGDSVHINDPIGKVGSSGRSTGTHLHYEISRNNKSIDPCNYLDPFEKEKCLK